MTLPTLADAARARVTHAWLTRRLLGLVLCALFSVAHAGKKPYSYFVTGNADAPVAISQPPSTPSLVLMGGGPDVDAAFRWMIERAGVRPGTGGRLVIIRATGTEAYNPYIYYSDAANGTSAVPADGWVGGAALGLSAVETLVIPSIAAANDPFVNSVVARADAVFIAGGDQSDYIKNWKGTALDRTLQALLARNAPLGGTSAGLAVLGQFDFAALKGTVTSDDALTNPYNRYVTLDPSPLSLSGGFIAPPALRHTILDSHLDTRDRMGRLITFLARLVAPTATSSTPTGCPGGILPASHARAIGIGVETALLVEGQSSNYVARRITNPSTTTESAVYFLRPLVPPTACASGTPLSMPTIEIRKLANDRDVFDLVNWRGVNPYYVDAWSGLLTSNPY